MTNADLLKNIKKRLDELFGDRFRGLVLYGSTARGDADKFSDVDALCLLDGNDEGNDLWAITEALYPVQLEDTTRHLHVIPVSFSDYESGEFELMRNARLEGTLV